MLINLGPELLFLHYGLLLVLSGFASLLILLILVLAVVHDLRHRRLRLWRDFNEVKIGLVSQFPSIVGTDDPYLLAGRADKADFRDADTIVNPSFSADENS